MKKSKELSQIWEKLYEDKFDSLDDGVKSAVDRFAELVNQTGQAVLVHGTISHDDDGIFDYLDEAVKLTLKTKMDGTRVETYKLDTERESGFSMFASIASDLPLPVLTERMNKIYSTLEQEAIKAAAREI